MGEIDLVRCEIIIVECQRMMGQTGYRGAAFGASSGFGGLQANAGVKKLTTGTDAVRPVLASSRDVELSSALEYLNSGRYIRVQL